MTPFAPSAAAAPAAFTAETVDKLDIYLPTVNVISFAGPGESGSVPHALAPIVKRLGTRVNWFALANQPLAGKNQTPEFAGFQYYSPKVPDWMVKAHYEVSHDYLAAILHGRPQEAKFEAESWKSYRLLCEAVASECLTVASDSFPTLCWLHDYQLALAAPLLAAQAGLILCQFWHVPWPQSRRH